MADEVQHRNIQKKVIHFGHNNKQQHYFMKYSKLSTTKEEKYIGVLITDNLKPSSQRAAAVNKTMSALRWSKISFRYLDKDIKEMEKIQRHATRMVLALRYLQNEYRLKKTSDI